MDINDIRSLATVFCFVALIGIAWWAYNPRHKKQFDDVAKSVLDNDKEDKEQRGA